MEQYEKKQVRVSLLRRFIDFITLEELKKSEMSGYDLVFKLHMKYDLLVSPGTVYALLYSLEREGLIRGRMEERKRVYELTNCGLENANLLQKECEEVVHFLANLQDKKGNPTGHHS